MSEFPALNFSNFVIKYLGEIETEFKNTLACLSGQKSCDTLPLYNEKVVEVASGLTIF